MSKVTGYKNPSNKSRLIIKMNNAMSVTA